MLVHRVFLSMLFALSGCVVWYGADYMPAAHVKKILAKEDTAGQLTGRITRDFQPARGAETAKASNLNVMVAYLGLKDGKACFYTTVQATSMANDPNGRRDADAFARKQVGRRKYAFQVRKSLDELSSSSAGWPSDPETPLDAIDISVHGEQKVFNVHGFDYENRGTHITYDVVMCGNAQPIEPESKYLTLMHVPKDKSGMGDDPLLFVWMVDPSAEAAANPASSSTTTTPSTPPAAKDLVGVLTKDGRFGTFLAALAKAGLAKALAGPQPLTIFAPTDAAFVGLGEAKRKALLADPGRLKDVLQNHLVVDAYQSAQFGTTARPTRAKTLQGKVVRVGLDAKGIVYIEGHRVSTADISADGGVIHVVDSVLEF